MHGQLILWIVFGVVMVGMAVLDLGVLNRKAHVVSMKEALLWSAVWISLALLFSVGIYWFAGQEKMLLFLTGYIVEEVAEQVNLVTIPEHQRKKRGRSNKIA